MINLPDSLHDLQIAPIDASRVEIEGVTLDVVRHMNEGTSIHALVCVLPGHLEQFTELLTSGPKSISVTYTLADIPLFAPLQPTFCARGIFSDNHLIGFWDIPLYILANYAVLETGPQIDQVIRDLITPSTSTYSNEEEAAFANAPQLVTNTPLPSTGPEGFLEIADEPPPIGGDGVIDLELMPTETLQF